MPNTNYPNWLKYTGIYARAGIESKLLHRKPIFLTVFVTSRCGLNCGHCFYREELLKGNINKEMRLDEYELFTAKCSPFPKLILTGGEPFLRDDLIDIAKCFYHNRSRSRQITIPTAGQHPEKIERLVEELLRSCPELILEIQLSIDGVKEAHDKIRGKGQFERLMNSYFRLKPIQDQNQRLRIRFNFTFSAQSQQNFEQTFIFVTQELQNPHFDMVLVRRSTADKRFFEPADMSLYKKAAQLLQQQERKKANGLLEKSLAERAGVERDIIRSHYEKCLKMDNCQAGTLTAIISEEGEVRPCEILDTSFGNLRDYNYQLDKIWKNQSARLHRDTIKREKCFCTFETTVRTTMVFQPKWIMKTLLQQIQSKFS